MAETLTIIMTERGNRYGPFKDNAAIAQDLKATMHATPNWQNLSDVQKEALDLIAMKISRILSTGADANYEDNWLDMGGYSELGRKNGA